MTAHILTVTQLTIQLKNALERNFSSVWIEGEISNLHAPQSGHIYCTLKDQNSQIKAVLYRSSQRFLKFSLEHGMQVICRGRVDVYEPRGEYQLVIEYIEPKGVGALQQAYEELKVRLEKEGLFNREHKKPLPMLPRSIGLITSPAGAAIRDILRVIRRRHPSMALLLYPVPVQGESAGPEIINALEYFNRNRTVDVLIVGRGGGSLEDLWAFNEERVARAIYASSIPVISAVGHETDYTISDFVADLRAPTPSAAAEMVAKSEEHFRELLNSCSNAITRCVLQKIERLRGMARDETRHLGDPNRKIKQYLQRVDELLNRLESAVAHCIRRDRAMLGSLASSLEHLNPLGILSRGYSITKKLPEEVIIKKATELKPGDIIQTKLQFGEIISRVDETRGPS